MGKSELKLSYSDWSKRIAQYEAQGIPSSAYMPIAQADMKKTYEEDAYPMSDLEAQVAVAAAASGTPPITESPRNSGSGIFHALGTIASNIEPDVSNLITALPRGIFDTAKEVVTPSTYPKIADVMSGVLAGKDGDLGGDLRALAGAPLLNLVPGLTDAAALTTGAGRKGLEEHPVSAALDTAGILGGVGELAGGALADSAGLAGADAATLAESASPVAALMRGHVVQAGMRAMDRTALAKLASGTETGARAAEEGLGPGQRVVRNVLKKMHHDKMNNLLNTTMARATGKIATQTHDFAKGTLDEIFGDMRNDPARLDAFGQKVMNNNVDAMDDDEREVFSKIKEQLRPMLESQVQDQLVQTPEGLFPKDSEAAGHYTRMAKAATRAERQEGRVQFAQDEADSTQRAAEDSTDLDVVPGSRIPAIREAAQPLFDSLKPAQHDLSSSGLARGTAAGRLFVTQMGKLTGGPLGTGLVPRFQRALDAYSQSLSLEDLRRARSALNRVDQTLNSKTLKDNPSLDADRATVATLHSELYGIKGKLDLDAKAQGAKERLAAAQNKLVEHKADVKRHGVNYYKSLERTPPANVTPQLAQALRDAADGKINASPDQIAQVHLLDETNRQLRLPQNTLYLSDLKSYLGDEEYSKILTDSLQNLLQGIRDGNGPLYMHSVRTGHESRALSTRIKSTDMTESQARVKGLDITNTLTNPYLALLSEFVNTTARNGTQDVIDTGLKPFSKTGEEIDPIYQRAAERKIAKGKVRYTNANDLARNLRGREYVKWSPRTGRRIPGGVDRPTDSYIPKDLYENFQHFTNGGKVDGIIQNSIYRGGMKLFRTSVLYGPRHFAHVVIGGLMAPALAHPTAFRNFAKAWPGFRDVLHGRTPDPSIYPDEIRHPIDYGSEEGMQHEVDRRIGTTYGRLYKQAVGFAGNINKGLENFENAAQEMYQAIVRLDRLRKGDDPTAALEAARRVVVNMDTASPFERTIMKQIMPFYSFTRFATLFLLQLPFDHPIRVSMLSSISNQAQEEWGTGLPMDMMNLFFIGKPDAAGNQDTVNLRNINPFRSIANSFTLSGFLSGLNPGIQAVASMTGINPLSGSGEMYPEISYNAQTGDLQTTRPSGDMWTAVESFVPEFSAIDGFFGLSDNLRSLRQDDPQAYHRELLSMFNIPFAPSNYNLPNVRGKTALNLYKGASQAIQNAQRSGNFTGDIGRYNLVPFNNGNKTELYTPAQIETYWNQLKNEYEKEYPGVNIASLLPTSY